MLNSDDYEIAYHQGYQDAMYGAAALLRETSMREIVDKPEVLTYPRTTIAQWLRDLTTRCEELATRSFNEVQKRRK